MGFWIFMLVSCLTVPVLLLLFGWMFRSHAPKTINQVFGYRTRRSTRNDDTWQFAQAEFGRLSRRWGLAEIPISALVMLAAYGRGEAAVSAVGGGLCVVQCISLFIIIWQVERALKAHFDKDGKLL